MTSFPGTLMDEYNVHCTLLEKRRTPDPVGGYRTEWVAGAGFDAAWEYQSAPETIIAEQQGVSRVYRIYVEKTLEMDYHDAFRREDNGQTYRVTNPGDDRMTPSFSRINRRLIEVEKWPLPADGEE